MFAKVFLTALLLPLLVALSSAEPGYRPIIAINMNISDKERTERVPMSTPSTYVDAVVKAGGLPIVVPPVLSDEHIAIYIDLADGFVFMGGADIDPARYGQEPHETWNPINPRREEFDFRFMESILDSGKPVLAVCLGMQQLNVVMGGSMIQDIPDLVETHIDHRQPAGQYAHDVEVVPGTKLHSLLRTNSLAVNSLHHQACVVPEDAGVIVSARAPDGIIEGIEIPGHPFAIGVQWHPEHLTQDEPHLNLFKGFVEAAREHARSHQPVSTAAE